MEEELAKLEKDILEYLKKIRLNPEKQKKDYRLFQERLKVIFRILDHIYPRLFIDPECYNNIPEPISQEEVWDEFLAIIKKIKEMGAQEDFLLHLKEWHPEYPPEERQRFWEKIMAKVDWWGKEKCDLEVRDERGV